MPNWSNFRHAKLVAHQPAEIKKVKATAFKSSPTTAQTENRWKNHETQHSDSLPIYKVIFTQSRATRLTRAASRSAGVNARSDCFHSKRTYRQDFWKLILICGKESSPGEQMILSYATIRLVLNTADAKPLQDASV